MNNKNILRSKYGVFEPERENPPGRGKVYERSNFLNFMQLHETFPSNLRAISKKLAEDKKV